MKTNKLDLAHICLALGAVRLKSGRYAHFDDATRAWYTVSKSDIQEYGYFLDHEDLEIRQDAYSHWCSNTIAKLATPRELTQIL